MLNVSHISKTFFKGTINEKKALNDLSLTLNDGDVCTVTFTQDMFLQGGEYLLSFG